MEKSMSKNSKIQLTITEKLKNRVEMSQILHLHRLRVNSNILFSVLISQIANIYVTLIKQSKVETYIYMYVYTHIIVCCKGERQVRTLTRSHVNPSSTRTLRNNAEDNNDLRAAFWGDFALATRYIMRDVVKIP